MNIPTSPPPALRIGGACAFWGDSNAGVAQLVRGGDVDVLVFDYLAELTMSLLQRARSKDPAAGYAGDFIAAVTPLLAEIAQQGIKLLSNAGAMNPQACAQALRKAADAAGVSLRIAVVQGDDLMPAVNTPRSDVPAVTHVDYSARVQTVHADTNPEFHRIISAFEKLTGCAVVVNTSFNVRGEPIVCTPDDAYRCFMRTDMDLLVVEDCLVWKSTQPKLEGDEDWRSRYALD